MLNIITTLIRTNQMNKFRTDKYKTDTLNKFIIQASEGRTALRLGAGLKKRNGAQYSHKTQSEHRTANTHTKTNSRQRRTQQNSILDEIRYIHRHFIYMCVIELLNIFERTFVILSNEIDSDSFATKSATTSNPAINLHLKKLHDYN